MSEYINRQALLREIYKDPAPPGIVRVAQLLDAIQEAPVVDVVPKSKLDKALVLIEEFEKTIDNGAEVCHGCHAKYAERMRIAKAEVAREIFKEIENTMFAFGTIPYKNAVVNLDTLDKLKKKYTEV